MTKRDLYIKAVASGDSWWTRPSGWLPMPTITAADNKFAGLYAVFEEDVDNNTITINVGAGLTINYGDGTIITSLAGTNTHNYDYATITSAVLVSSDGRNYKQVMVEVDLTGVTAMLLNQIITGRPNRNTSWLDILASGSNLIEIRPSGEAIAKYLERLIVLNMSATAGNLANMFTRLALLKILEYPNIANSTNFLNVLFQVGDVRDSNGLPLNLTGVGGTDLRNMATGSAITEIGNIDYPTGTLAAGAFLNSQIKKIGDINIPSITNLGQFIQGCIISTMGTITVTSALTILSTFARFCVFITEIVFVGDMSGVNNTLNAFQNNYSLTRLILPNITIGFDIRNSRVTGTDLQDLFTSLGTAAGVQTITLPTFTSAEPTTIATGKGYTIAYA